ncbi:MAG: hypothetical protein OEX13_16685 [Gammaproteobacteria bacterium]|nr:hypothetical protein [Gammaproteobacteria bacterium]
MPVRMLAATACAVCVGVAPGPAGAESQHDLLAFTSVDTFYNFSVSNPEVDDSFVRPALDLLYSYSKDDRFRVLGEYLWSSHESELERMQVGWRTGNDTMVWLGRFHTNAKFWTSEYHHGQFLQTSITRPSVEEWEDESGPIPSHVSGLAIEHEFRRKDLSGMQFSASAGLAPRFVGEELEPFDLLDPESDHDLSLNFSLIYRPNVTSGNQFGALFGWNDIDVDSASSPNLADLDSIDQLTYGVFADWSWSNWRVLGSVIYLDNDLRYFDGHLRDKFAAGYVQLEYELSDDWRLFGRSDNGIDEDDSIYLRLLPAFVAHRHMLGVRWDFATFHSFTAEIADTSAQGEDVTHDHFKEFRLQWSGVFQ